MFAHNDRARALRANAKWIVAGQQSRTNVNGGGGQVVRAVHARVDGEQEADEDFVGEHQRGLCHMEAVPCKGGRRNRPAVRKCGVLGAGML